MREIENEHARTSEGKWRVAQAIWAVKQKKGVGEGPQWSSSVTAIFEQYFEKSVEIGGVTPFRYVGGWENTKLASYNTAGKKSQYK